MAIDYKQLGKNLHAARKQRGFTQQKLAELLDYSPEHISQLENGHRPIQFDAFNFLCEELDISYEDLLRGATSARISSSEDVTRENIDAISEFSTIIYGCSPKRIKLILEICRSLATFPR